MNGCTRKFYEGYFMVMLEKRLHQMYMKRLYLVQLKIISIIIHCAMLAA